MWQIWTRPRPGPPQEPHPHHHTPARPCHHDDPGPRAAVPGEKDSMNFELGTVRAGLVRLGLTDTNWDILANSLGAPVVYGGHLLGGWLGDRKRG